MPRALIPIGGGFYSNIPEYALHEKSAQVINWVLDEAGTNVSRPGMVTVVGVSARPIIGMFAYKEWVVVVDEDRRVFSVSEDGSSTELTTPAIRLPGAGTPAGFVDDGDTLIIAGGDIPYIWNGVGGIAPQSTADTSALPHPSHLAIVNSFLVANDVPGQNIYYTTTLDHSDWDLDTRVFQAESNNDPCIALIANAQFLHLFGPESVDVYYPTNAASPAFARSHTVQRGLAGTRGVALVEGVIYFLDNRRHIVKLALNERMGEIISLEIEKTLQDFTRVDDVIAHRIEIDGKHFLLFNFPSQKTALVYDYALSRAGDSVWYEWRGRSGSEWTAIDISSYCFQPQWNRHFCSGFANGTIYELTPDAGTDHGNPILRVRRTGYQNRGVGTIKKRSKLLRGRMTRGTTREHTSDAYGYEPILMLRERDEMGHWSSYYEISMGLVGDTDMLAGEVRGLGTYRDRQWEYSCDAPVARLSITSLEEDFDVYTR